MNRLQERYEKEVVPAMMEKFGYKNIMQVPKIEKVVINMGVGEAKDNPKVLESAVIDLQIIEKQKPVLKKDKNKIEILELNSIDKEYTKILLCKLFFNSNE